MRMPQEPCSRAGWLLPEMLPHRGCSAAHEPLRSLRAAGVTQVLLYHLFCDERVQRVLLPRTLGVWVELGEPGVVQPSTGGSGVSRRFPGQNSRLSLPSSPLTSVSCLLGARSLERGRALPHLHVSHLCLLCLGLFRLHKSPVFKLLPANRRLGECLSSGSVRGAQRTCGGVAWRGLPRQSGLVSQSG